ncbi:hypothetical protein [Salinimicrobium oceani]|uniref:DUF748 domain-containing protein n=1 Tax=Salinimicrobium oceani TaxID=2722702 RepID=A0ABX1CY61_9FLAO|nr:hypothetical protein [Salinimicrobium oceani]NJW52319.1 hypothetical protein [Salinimicrobium oceani]
MKRKHLLIITLTILGLLLLGFLLNLFVKNRIERQLDELDSQISYENLEVNIFLNRIEISSVEAERPALSIGAKNVIFKGISYRELITSGEVVIDHLQVEQPRIIQYDKRKEGDTTQSRRQIRIKEIQLTNGIYKKMPNDSAATAFISFPEISLRPNKGDFSSLEMESYHMRLDSVYFKMNEEHFISLGASEVNNGKIEMKDFRIASFYSKNEFDQNIPYEKDRIELKVPEISLSGFDLQNHNDSIFIRGSKMVISEAFLKIYRNKLITDDTRRKALYNELLRKAPFKIDLEEIRVEKSEIIYEELAQQGRPAAAIRFAGVEGDIKNLHNIKKRDSHPRITARANFMRGTIVSLDWTFPVFSEANQFHVSGHFGRIEGEALDPFLIPAMNVQARGEINEVNFDFYGNEDILRGDFSMQYDKLRVELLKKEGSKKRNFLSSLANLLVDNDGEAGAQEWQVKVERNKQRSFWNFLWIGLRQGFTQILKQF